MPKKKDIVKPEHLSPGLAAGLTTGVPADEALKQFPVTTPKATDSVAHMKDADKRLERGRNQFAQFVADNDDQAVWVDGVTDRPQMDYVKTYTPEGMRFLREGRQCLRCDEPQPDPFPPTCDLCGYPMKERQIVDISLEFDGDRHVGPAKPISEYLEKLEERTEKRKFIDRVLAGGQGRIPKEWLQDKELFPDGPPKLLS